MNDLPHGWAEASVGSIAESLIDGPFGSNLKTEHYQPTGARVIRLQNIADGRFDDRDKAHISLARYDSLKRHEARPGDVLIAALGEVLPRVCLVPPDIGPAIVKADCFRLRPHQGISANYLAFILSAPQIRKRASIEIAGVGRPRLNLRKVSALGIPIPPNAEQERIVAAIEEQFSRLDAGVTALERARQNLMRMRTAVLQAAVSGTLTATDQSMWTTRRIADVALIASGQTPRGLELAKVGPIPFYKVGDMNIAAGQFMASSRGYVDLPTARSFGLHIRPAGTVIFPKRGGAIATNKKRILREPAAYDLNTMGLVPGADIDPGFLYLWISSIDLSRLADGSNVPQINHGDLADLELRVPPWQEQGRVVVVADAALSLVDGLEAALSHAERRSGRLRSSILAAAFSGKLVPQEATDEPASILLQRIAAERAAHHDDKAIQARKPRVPRKKVTA
jgi:restriction endonuclease S subunit